MAFRHFIYYICVCMLFPDLPPILHMLFYFAFRFFHLLHFFRCCLPFVYFIISGNKQPVNRLKNPFHISPNFDGIFQRLFAIRLTLKSATVLYHTIWNFDNRKQTHNKMPKKCNKLIKINKKGFNLVNSTVWYISTICISPTRLIMNHLTTWESFARLADSIQFNSGGSVEDI